MSTVSEMCITVVHALPGRLRLRVSQPLADPARLEKAVMNRSGVRSASYTSVSQTLLVFFDDLQVTVEELLLRAAMSLSLANDLAPVAVKPPPEGVPLSQLSLLSGAMLVMGHAVSFLGVSSAAGKAVQMAAGVGAAMAIGEHIYDDIRAKNSPDPEVLSIGYLLISLLRGRLLQGASVAWAMTFARHILEPPAPSLMVHTSHTSQGCDLDGCELEAVVSRPEAEYGLTSLLTKFPRLLAGAYLAAEDHAFQEMQALAKERNNILEGLENVNRGIRLKVLT